MFNLLYFNKKSSFRASLFGATVHTKFEQSNYNNLECVCKQVAYWIYDNAGFSLSKFEKKGNIPCREPDYVY